MQHKSIRFVFFVFFLLNVFLGGKNTWVHVELRWKIGKGTFHDDTSKWNCRLAQDVNTFLSISYSRIPVCSIFPRIGWTIGLQNGYFRTDILFNSIIASEQIFIYFGNLGIVYKSTSGRKRCQCFRQNFFVAQP